MPRFRHFNPLYSVLLVMKDFLLQPKMKTFISIVILWLFQNQIAFAQCPATANLASNTCATGTTLSVAGSYSDARRITTNTTIAGTVTIQNGGSLSICSSTSSFGALNLSNNTNTIIINAGATLTLGTTGTPSGNMTWDGTATIMNYGTLIINDLININNGNITFINAGIIQSNDNGGINIQTTSVFINRGTAQFRSVTTQRPNVIKIENGSSTTFNAYTHGDPNSGNSLPIIFCGTGSANTSFTGSVNVTNASNVFLINRNGQTVYACTAGATYAPVGASSANLGSGVLVGNPNAAGTITGLRSICKPAVGVTYSVASITGATSYTWSVPTGASITAGGSTNSITVSFANNAVSGTISVAGVNSCGTGTPSSITVYPINCDIDGDGIANTSDLDDDNDGISDYVEACGAGATSFVCLTADPSADSDGDGLVNYMDPDYAAANGTTINANGVCTSLDADGDGIINQYDLDSDNDGIPDVIEAFGVDTNGDGKIDNFVDANSDGLSDNVASCTQRLTNPSFETPVQPSIGNNLLYTTTFGGWYTQSGGQFNIIKTNGSFYGGGPNNAQNGTQYVDIINAADYFQQDVTVVTSRANVSFGGYFSSREQSGGYVNWTGRIDILNTAGTIVATSSTKTFVNADGAEDQTWYYLSGTATLNPGNYFFRVYIGDFGNFDNANFTVCYTSLGATDTDGDGIPNALDLDSDGDGIPDVVEAGGTDANNDGKIDGFIDTDGDGFSDAVDGDVGNDGTAENSAGALILSGTDTNGDGRADSWPNKNADLTGYPNLYDLDSDGDGILDAVESGLIGRTGSNGTVGASNGIITGARTNGWANTVRGLASLSLTNSDADTRPNYLDIDSDNDGITDNVEAQSTTSYKIPSDVDADGDGINDVYELAGQIGTFGGGGITPFDKDGDSTPDYIDTDTDNDGVPDRNEGDRNNPFVTVTQSTIDNSGDTDGDGLMNIFDNVTITSLTAGNYYKNVTMGNMGAGVGFTDNFDGPIPSGSLIGLQKSDPSNTIDRDWRNASILPLQIVNLLVNYTAPDATIKWNVINEQEIATYDVEFSLDGVAFTTIQQITAKNNGNPAYTVLHNLNAYSVTVVYYRVKQINRNGQVFYTNLIPLRLSVKSDVVIHGNPFSSSIGVTYTSQQKELLNVQFHSVDGRLITNKIVNINVGSNYFTIDNLMYLQTGTYILSLKSNISSKTIQVYKN